MNKNIRILIVDDNDLMRTMIRNMLENNGYNEIVEASDGLSAFKVLKSQQIDFVFADWNMLGMSGIELLKKIREDSDIGKTPFIMLSVEGLSVSVDTALKCGANDFISKPFTSKILIERLEKVMAGGKN